MFMSAITLFLLTISFVTPTSSLRIPHTRNSGTVTKSRLKENIISLPLTKYTTTQNLKDIITSDNLRVKSRYASISRDQSSFVLSSFTCSNFDRDVSGDTIAIQTYGVSYVANVTIGNSIHSLIVDTGSSNTWIGAFQTYHPTPLAKDTGDILNVTYGTGSLVAHEYTDRVELSPELIIPNQMVGIAEINSTIGFGYPFDGIIGVGPTSLTSGTVQHGKKRIRDVVPTVTDNLYSEGIIKAKSVGISFKSANTNATNGVMTFGGSDPSRYVGDIVYAPPSTEHPYDNYFSVQAQFLYDNENIMNSSSLPPPISCIVDTGTTLVYIPKQAYSNYARLTRSKVDQDVGLLSLSNPEAEELKTLDIKIGETSYPLTAKAQQWPRAINYEVNGTDNQVYLLIGNGGNLSVNSVNCILGQTFLERFYAIFDTSVNSTKFTDASDEQKPRVGLAFAPWTLDKES